MFCLLCRLHHGKSKHNKSSSYGMEPAVHFQTLALMEHCSGQKHQDSIAAEMLTTSIIQEKPDERNLYQHIYDIVLTGSAWHCLPKLPINV